MLGSISFNTLIKRKLNHKICTKNMYKLNKSNYFNKRYIHIENKIINRLKEKFNPYHLDVVNESYKHNVPPGSETHFKVEIVSDLFEGKSIVEHHRMVNESLSDILGDIHALAIKTSTKSKWEGKGLGFKTPSCMGGSKK